MPDLPEVREKFVADTTGYSGKLREAAQEADRFSRQNDQAALAARKMGLAAKEAAEKAERAQKNAADAAEKLARGELKVEEAAQAAAKAERELERASIKAAEAELAAAKAADKQAAQLRQTTAEELAAAKAADHQAAQLRQVARDAELAAAAQHLGSLKAVGATREYNDALRRLKAQHGDLKTTALAGFEEMKNEGNAAYRVLTSASESLGEVNKLWVVGIVNGLALLPSAASAAGGALTLALGGALTAVAIKSQASNADVKASFSDLRSHVTSELRQISEPFHGTLLHISDDLRHAFDTLAPSLDADFLEMSSAVDRFSNRTSNSFQELNPAIESIGHAFSNVLDDLGPRMPAIMNNIGTSIKAITDAVAANPQAIGSFVQGLSEIARATGDSIGFLIRYKNAIMPVVEVMTGGGPIAVMQFAHGVATAASSLKYVGESLTGTSHGFDVANMSFATFDQQATMGALAAHHLATAQQLAALTTQQLASALDKATSAAQGAFDAETKYRQALLEANQQAKASNAGIDGMGKAAIANREALSQLAKSIVAVESSGSHTAAQINAMRESFVKAALGMHVSRTEAEQLANKLLGVSRPVNLKVNDGEFLAKLHRAQGLKIDPKTGYLKGNNADYFNKWLKAQGLRIDPKTGYFKGNNADYVNKFMRANGLRIDPKTGVIRGNTGPFWSAVNNIPSVVGSRTMYIDYVARAVANVGNSWGSAQGGLYKKGYARGDEVSGLLTGPGTGTSDSIPMPMLSNGEFIVRAAQTKKHLALLRAINEGRDGFAIGGRIHYTGMHAAKTHRTPEYVIHSTGMRYDGRAAALARPEHLAALAAQQSLERMRRTIYGGWFVGRPSTVGSAHGTVVQHVTNVHVTVQGSVTTANRLAADIQSILLNNRMTVSLPAGR